MAPVLTALDLAADPEAWRGAGFTVDDGTVRVDGVAIRFVPGATGGIVGWALDTTVGLLGPERVGAARAAVQPGRRIATIRATANLGTAVAFMSPPATVDGR